MEEVHDVGPTTESFGLALSWWDKDNGFQGLWCENHNPQGCAIGRDVNGKFKWDGKQQIVDNEFQRNGKTFSWHEVFTDITPTSFVQTADIGEKGGPLKRWLTIHATRVTDASTQATQTDSDQAELTALMARRRKASMEGDVETIANSMADDYVQTDINGYRQDKTAWLSEYFRPLAELIKFRKFQWKVYDQKDLEFRMYGDCAVVTGNLEAKAIGARPGQHTWVEDASASFSGTLHFTHVYIKRNGRWLLGALHNQLAAQPQQSNK
jgi:ketosteroid isomerase-like protein